MFPEDDDDKQKQFENYFPTDELRRRQSLGEIMAPGSEDELDSGDATASIKPDNAALAPPNTAMQDYAKVAGAVPKPSDYKPSIWRRIGAGLAGAGAGWRNPAEGVQVAHEINQQPYQNALQQWQAKMQGAQAPVQLAQSQQAQALAQQKANAATTSSQARMRAAQADEEERRWQMSKPQPWQPHTEEEQERVNASKLNPRNPTDFDQYSQDPAKFTQFKRDTEKPSTAETVEEREKLEGMRESAENKREEMRQSGETSRETMRLNRTTNKPIEPSQQVIANRLALQSLIRKKPEYQAFIIDTDKTLLSSGKGVNLRPRLPSEIDNSQTSKGSLARTTYQQFLSDLEKEKRSITGQQGGNTWNIQEQK